MIYRVIFILLLACASAFAGVQNYSCYRTANELYATMTNLSTSYPHLVKMTNVGTTELGREIKGLVLSNSTNGVPKWPVLFICGVHANEWGPQELVMRWAEDVTASWATNGESRLTLDYAEIHFIPVVNLDQRLKQDTNNNYFYIGRTNSNGVNINRNFPPTWGWIDDDDPLNYEGTGAASEAETQAMTNYTAKLFNRVRAGWETNWYGAMPDTNASGCYFDMHTQSATIDWVWGNTNAAPPGSSGIAAIGKRLGALTGYQADQSSEIWGTGYGSGTGGSWTYGVLGVPGVTWEYGLLGEYDCANFTNHAIPVNLPAIRWAAKQGRLPYINAQAPEVLNLSVVYDLDAQTLSITAQANDTRNGAYVNHAITAARVAIGTPSWLGGDTYPLTITQTGTTGIANISGTLGSDGRTGWHLVMVEAADSVYGVPAAQYVWFGDKRPSVLAGSGTIAGNGLLQ